MRIRVNTGSRKLWWPIPSTSVTVESLATNVMEHVGFEMSRNHSGWKVLLDGFEVPGVALVALALRDGELIE